jgi:hypothetical protein
MTKDNLTTNTSNEAESPAFLVGAVSGRFQIRVSEILQLKNRLREINDNEIRNIDFLDESGLPIQIDEKNIEDWKFTGLNITDFIDSNFYIDGFSEDDGRI